MKLLGEFKKEFDVEAKKFFRENIAELKKIDYFTGSTLEYVEKFVMSGGKRLRPALMYYGYVGSGGKNKKEMLKVAVSIELIHAFLLIHDDIADRGSQRHGIDTLNVHFEKVGRRLFPGGDSSHFGNSIALIVGDMVGALGNRIIFESNFEPKLIMQALSKLQRIISLTVVGQTQDIFIEYRKKASEKDVMKMYEYKTARYTFEGPLHLGAILGGADKTVLDGFSKYSLPVGIAFQIQDDILGVFGVEKKVGKDVGADVREGKQTLLVVKAKEKSTKAQLKIINSILGKQDITANDLLQFQAVLKETGSLQYAKDMAAELIKKGQKALAEAPVNSECTDFLGDIAEYMIQRDV